MSDWLSHVKKTMKMNPGKPLKDVLKMAKKTYKKVGKAVAYGVTGKKSRRHRKSKSKSHRRRHRK